MQDEQDWYLNDAHSFQFNHEKCDHNRKYLVLKSISPRPRGFGYLCKSLPANCFIGERIQMRAKVKTDLPDGASVQLWLRVDGDWKKRADCFDNMFENRIKGISEWASHVVTVSVPEKSQKIMYGVLLNGTGTVWLDEIVIESVEEEVVPKAKKPAKPG